MRPKPGAGPQNTGLAPKWFVEVPGPKDCDVILTYTVKDYVWAKN